MKKNLFNNAFFGKAYKTRDGRNAIFLRTFVSNGYNYYVSTGELEYSVKEDGKVDKNLYPHAEDIISEWQELLVVKCKWQEYYDYHIMMPNGEGHVRVSFFDDETIISDLYVAEEHRCKGYATILLDKVDELLDGRKAVIYPLEEWQREWYKQRGYAIGVEKSIDEEELNKLAEEAITSRFEYTKHTEREAFKTGYRKAKEE